MLLHLLSWWLHHQKWWFISDAQSWVYLDGEFDEAEVRKIESWINNLSEDPGINKEMVSLIGFSAGAYAATEILASGKVNIYSFIVGAVHGHGAPELPKWAGKRRVHMLQHIEISGIAIWAGWVIMQVCKVKLDSYIGGTIANAIGN